MKFLTIILFTIISFNVYAQTLEDISVEETLMLIESNAENPAFTIIDVRTPQEYLPAHIEGAFNKNYYDTNFEQQMDSLNKERVYLIYCQSGGRSGQTLQIMGNLGFETVYNMLGGMNAWNAASYPTTDVIPDFIDLTAPLESTTNNSQLNEHIIECYPNPANEIIYISGIQNEGIMKIFNMNGQLLEQLYFQNNKPIDIAHLPQGNYMLQVLSKNNEFIQLKKFVKP